MRFTIKTSLSGSFAALILLLCFIAAQANFTQVAVNGSGSVGGACWTTGADGFTVICSTTITSGTCAVAGARNANGTCFVAVSASGVDGTCDSFSSAAAARAAPCLHISTGLGKIRSNSDDHLLINKGDTFTDQDFSPIHFNGISSTRPVAIIADGTGARPLVKTNPSLGDGGCIGTAAGGGGLGLGNNIAFIGIECYNYTRDPANIGAGFDPTNGAQNCTYFGNTYTWLLIEDVKCSYYVTGFAGDADIPNNATHSNTKVRRSIFVHMWQWSGHSACIHDVGEIGGFLIEENLFDTCGWEPGLLTPVTATITIASPGVVTANFGYTPPSGAGMTFHDNSGDTLPTGLSKNTQYNVVNIGVAGANTFELNLVCPAAVTQGCNNRFTASISTTTLAVTAMLNNGTIASGDSVAGTGISAGTKITAPVNISISSGTYNSGTGAVSLTMSSTAGLAPGAPFTLSSMTGTGSFASLNGTWTATAGTTGTTVNFTAPQSLTLTISGGTLDAAGGVGLYTINNSQTVGSESMTSALAIVTSGSQAGTHQIAWDIPDLSPQASGFNHAIYLDSNNSPATIHGNIITNASNVAHQMRNGGNSYNNLVARNPDCGFAAGTNSTIHDGVCIEGQGHTCNVSCPSQSDGSSIVAGTSGSITNMLVTKSIGGGGTALFFGDGVDDCGDGTSGHGFLFTLANPTVATLYGQIVQNGQAVAAYSNSGSSSCTSGTNTLPAHIVQGTPMFVSNNSWPGSLYAAQTFNLSLTSGGALISTLGDTQSGVFGIRTYAQNSSITGNTIYAWGNSTGNANIGNTVVQSSTNTISGNTNVNSGGGSFPDNTRNPGSYNAQISFCASLPAGCTATTAAFITNAAAQSKDNWHTELMAKSANAWIGAGFGMTFN